MLLRHGVGSNCSVLINFLHPTKLVKSVIANVTKGEKEFDLIIVRNREEKVLNWRKQSDVVLRSNDSKMRNKEVCCCESFATVQKEGNAANIFVNTSANEWGRDWPADFEGAVIHENLQHHTGSWEDIIHLRNQGFQVDDDNDPVKENIPDTNTEDKPTYKDLGHNGIDPRKMKDMMQINKLI